MAGQRIVPPSIGWDPTPGDVEDTRELARRLGKLATELGTALGELERIECGAWKGKTAIAFTEYIGEDVTPLIRKSHDSFDKASRALHRWAGELQEFQEETDRLDKSAKEKLDAKSTAKEGTDEYGKASGDVNGVIQKVHELEERYRRAAGHISKELDKAADIAPDEPGFWDKLGTGIADAWGATGDWLKEHADLIKEIGDVLSLVSSALGVLAIITAPFEPIGAIFAAAAMITSGAALLTHVVAKAAGADVSWADIGFDALGILPGVKGLTGTAELAKGANAGARALKLGSGFRAAEAESKLFVLFGPAKTIPVIKLEAGGSRMALAVESGLQNVRKGQLLGTQGINLVASKLPFIKSAEDIIAPMSNAGRALDATIKGALTGNKAHTIATNDYGN
ncbi:enoyl-CoA hydratase/isomerase family protein [Streptomyces sp. ME02-8801-2C]|uniref:enoyl-CoA hydratase/isomerase family protein n=1 Tax=Streptomyces sp. ME02-8801-2C TaxID=3028680 RepID=UPI0029A1A5DA|nr:enoyl-CoA hydratase/isomerase family protein [Streptomyces sp. ME02-8801-2C]MDX3454353.1 enoyl-CoA hydratase/isomerase family protein [Streptomyces sp. ME02-8801-2C]